jgi:ABC-2 type transport system permease protein
MSRAAPFIAAVAAQASMEARLTARRAENLLAMIGIPGALLVFFGLVGAPAGGEVASLLPGTLALAIVASGLVNLGIATAYERGYGVLKRLGGAPLGRPGLVLAKVAVVAGIAVLQVVALILLAGLLGWRPGPEASVAAVAVVAVVGVAAFAGLGLLLAGLLRPEATLVLTNVIFLAAILLGGVLVPVTGLPEPLATISGLTPVGALGEAFRAALGTAGGAAGGGLLGHLAVLGAWAVASIAAAARSFAWD